VIEDCHEISASFLMRVLGTFGSKRSDRELAAEIESRLQLHLDDNVPFGARDCARRSWPGWGARV
jgi:hypothetical protein